MNWRREILIDSREHRETIPVTLSPGWQRLRLSLKSHHHFGIRKRLCIRLSNHDGIAHEDEFAWNDLLTQDIVFPINVPAANVELRFLHAGGTHEIALGLGRVSSLRATATALRCKLKLLSQFNCLQPVLARGTRLLLRGEFRAVAGKIWKGLPDSRTMNLQTRRAEEAGAAWWRRRALSPATKQQLFEACETIEEPKPIAIIIPVDATRVDHARQAVFSVLRQVYPHWQLRLLWPGAKPPKSLVDALQSDSRSEIVAAECLHTALRQAVQSVPCDRMLLLSPDCELAEDALIRLHDVSGAVRLDDGGAYGSIDSFESGDEKLPTAMSVVRWARSITQTSLSGIVLGIESGQGTSQRLFATPATTAGIHLAANITGISGWDAVAFQVLRGLSRSGVSVHRHPEALVKTHTLPPGMAFMEKPRSPSDPQIVVAAPFQVKPFSPDAMTAVLTMWECDRLAAESVRQLNKAKLVIVPSAWGRETFRQSGVAVPIEVVPLGIDPLLYYPRAEAPSQCVFGTAGALGAGGIRKNINGVIDAFRTAFPNETDVRLRVKITPNCPPMEIANDSRIEMMRAVLPAAEVAAWNRSLTAYVNASMAEGFGLHLLEAMACGVPLISTNASAVADYHDDDSGYVIAHREVEVNNDYYCGTWYEPDVVEMVAAMRRVYSHRVEAKRKGEAAAAKARGFTWRDTGRLLMNALKTHGVLR